MNTDVAKFTGGKKCVFYAFFLVLVQIGSVGQAQFYASQGGHLLDANPRLGSMGINLNTRLDVLVPRINNNLYITGNITGGSRFQGLVPYRSPMEFQSTLGSSTLSNFRRDSVGMANLGSPINTPQPYVDFSRTLTGTQQQQVVRSHEFYQSKRVTTTPFTARINQQNNWNLAMRTLEQPNFSLNVSKPRQFNPIKPLGAVGQKPEWFEGAFADLLQGKAAAGLSPESILPITPGQIAVTPEQNLRPGEWQIQPVQPLTQEQEIDDSVPPLLTSENRDLADQNRQQEHEHLNALGPGTPGDRNILHIQPMVPTPTGSTEQGTGGLANPPMGSIPGMTTDAQMQTVPGIPAVGINPAMSQSETPNDDAKPANQSPLAQVLPESSNLLTNRSPFQWEQPSYWPKPFQPKLRFSGAPLPYLTSSGPSKYQSNFEARSRRQFRANMQQADELLRKHKYYRAADAYGTAIVYDFSSGAAHLGKAHALFGAGEYMSAAYFLYQALKREPTLAKSQTDLRKYFADEKIFQSRLHELNDWQTRSNAVELKFLQGYVLYQIGSMEPARSLLREALTLDPTMTVIQPILKVIPTEKNSKYRENVQENP